MINPTLGKGDTPNDYLGGVCGGNVN